MQPVHTEKDEKPTLSAIKDEIAQIKSATLIEFRKLEKNLKALRPTKRHRESVEIFTVDPSVPPLRESVRKLDIE